MGSHVASAFADDHVVATYHRTVPAGGIALDVSDAQATRALIQQVRPAVIVLAAADPWVERCERDPEATRLVNVAAALPIARAARDIGAAFVVFSSEYVFDGSNGRYEEDDPVRPINEYGRQKVALETLAREAPRHLICRTSGVFGWEIRRKNFVLQLVDSVRAGREFVVASDQVITPTFAPDAARAVRALVDLDVTGVVHVAGPRTLQRPEFAALVCEAFGLDQDLIRTRATSELGLAAPRPLRAGLSDGRLRSLLGHALSDPRTALATMVADERPGPSAV